MTFGVATTFKTVLVMQKVFKIKYNSKNDGNINVNVMKCTFVLCVTAFIFLNLGGLQIKREQKEEVYGILILAKNRRIRQVLRYITNLSSKQTSN